MKQSTKYILMFAVFGVLLFGMEISSAKNYIYEKVSDNEAPVDADTNKNTKQDTLRYPISDRPADKYNSGTKHEFDLQDPANIKTEVEYDTASKSFSIKEKIGSQYFRNPSYLTMDEFIKYQTGVDEEAYWKKRANSMGLITKKGNAPPSINLGNAVFDRLFGGTTIEVKPTGNIDLSAGGNWQNIQNPTFTAAQRKSGIFDFDEQMNLSMLAKVGDKIRMNFNYNTKATFDFENQTKLQYAGKEDDIIKKLEVGTVSFPLKSSLIQGVQSLFGIHTEMQFGKLMVNSVISQQKSKKESLTIKGGAQTQQFSVSSDMYDVNKHFLLDHFFRSNYNNALSKFPLIQSQANITKIEVWITSKSGSVDNARDIIAFSDLGEPNPQNTNYTKAGQLYPSNAANDLYNSLIQQPNTRNTSSVINTVLGMGLTATKDFEKTFAKKLTANEFSFNPKLGFISINANLSPDDVVGVAYQYTYNGRVFQVGEFAQDLPPDSTNPKVQFLKLLKSTTPNPKSSIWDLMMKNIYSLGSGNVSKDGFLLNVFYQDAAGAEKRYLPEGVKAGEPLISILNLDRLNSQNDPQPDGVFDFVEGTTINTQQGKIIFPVLEPFGKDLKPAFGGNVNLEKKYLYTYLYDSTQIIAQQFPQFNRFLIKGSYKSTSSSDIYLGGFNIPQGSVSVMAGGQKMTENIDYQIDYGLGKIKILNNGILNSGVPINISYENNATFGFQVQNLMGTHLTYNFSPKFTMGSTLMRLSERPFSQKVTYGDDPIKNTVLGLEANYQSEVPALTRLVDKLPIYSTTAPSIITASGEVAKLMPGHSKLIDVSSKGGEVYIDDFEGTKSSYDLKFPLTSWNLSSAPENATDNTGKELFPEAKQINTLNSNFNRAKICWYNIDPSMVSPSTAGIPDYLKADKDQLSDNYVRLVTQSEVFPNRTITNLTNNITTLDLAYYPSLRGPYNFDDQNITADGRLTNPQNRWGGISRYIDYSDFETSNVEFIEFWVMDPFMKNPNSTGGSLYFNLGNISEDVLKDSRKSFENGIPYPFDATKVEQTVWGQVPKFQQQINYAFDNIPEARTRQDVGYDGMNDDEERIKQANYLNNLKTRFGATSQAYLDAYNDPSNDNYHYIKGDDYSTAKTSVKDCYKQYNNPQGNSPVSTNSQTFSSSYTNLPESEDLNRDNTLNENEQYFQYRIDMKPNMQVGTNYLVNKQVSSVALVNGTTDNAVTWYQFKVPIHEFNNAVGGIADFRSIRFMRMFLTGFQDSTIFRFAKLEFGRNQWRKYNYSLKNPGEIVPDIDNSATDFNITSVSIEENGSRSPINYVMPPDILRQQQQVSNGQTALLNEQSISEQVCNLENGNSKGAFKSIGQDFRNFQKIKMYIHAEGVEGQSPLKDNDIRGFIRLGNDFTGNYYEYQVPLKLTPFGSKIPSDIWPTANDVDLVLQDLVNVKLQRDKLGLPHNILYSVKDSKGNFIKVIGNPNLGDVKTAMLGINNPAKDADNPNDDGANKCAEVWFDELRLANINEQGGYAAVGRAVVQLADLATVRMSGDMHTIGYGNIDQKVNQRQQNDYYQYNLSTNLNGGKLFPKTWGVQLPIFAGYSTNVTTPKYNPYDLDVNLKNTLSQMNAQSADSLKKMSQDVTSIQSFSVQNVRINPEAKPGATPTTKKPWSVTNFDVSYTYANTKKHNSLNEADNLLEQHGSLGYSYATTTKPKEPFKKLIKSKSKYYALIKDFNIKLLPSNFGFRTQINRIFGSTQVRNLDDGAYKLPTTYNKFFTWSRTYNMRWDIAKSLSIDYTAANQSKIDEPNGAIDSKAKKQEVWNNFKGFGRNTNYTQSLNANYNLPLSKIPLLDWITMRTSYASTYNWTATSLLSTSQGNIVGNTQVKQLNGDFNFTQLYNKSKFLRKVMATPVKIVTPKTDNNSKQNTKENYSNTKKGNILKGGAGKNGNGFENNTANENTNTDAQQANEKILTNNDKTKITQGGYNIKADSVGKDGKKYFTTYAQKLKDLEKKKADEEKKRLALEKKNRKAAKQIPDALHFVGNLLMSVKRVSFALTQNRSTALPGYMDGTQALGVNWRSSFTQAPLAFGYQPDRNYLDNLGKNNLYTTDSLFNANFAQTFSKNLNVTASLEPFKDCKIDVSFTQTFNKAYNELYKDTTSTSGLNHLNPYESGGFSISFLSFKTMFQGAMDSSGLTKAFNNFSDYRKIISGRLGLINPYTNSLASPDDPGYTKGYNRYAQEVIIPSFLAAYTGTNPNKYALERSDPGNISSNPFRFYFPKPNWRFTYNGLAKMNAIKDYFTNINLTNGYNSTLSMNGFNSSLFYNDKLGIGYPSFIDSISHNYVPYFFVPNITINETFSPLAGIDATMKNGTTFHFEYKKARTLSMSLLDYQLSETKSKEISFGYGRRLKKVRVPLPWFGLNTHKNDINIKADFSLRDDKTSTQILDSRTNIATRGQKVIVISPSIDYIYSQNLTIRLFFDRRQTIPTVSNAFPITTTRGGIMFRFLLGQ